jgi:hypothetical protein
MNGIGHALDFIASQVWDEEVHEGTLRRLIEQHLHRQLDETSDTIQSLPVETSLETSQHGEVDKKEIEQQDTHPSQHFGELCHDISVSETKNKEVRKRDRKRERERETDRQTERERDKQTDRQTEREREKERQRQRERKREREEHLLFFCFSQEYASDWGVSA